MTGILKLVKKGLTAEEILSKVTPYDVYRYYFGNFEVGKKYLNHLRGDKSQPSFTILYKNNTLIHIDYGSDYWRGDCFSLVRQIYNCDYKKALEIVATDFNITKDTSPRLLAKEWIKPEFVEKKRKLIQVVTKKFTTEELNYWNDNYCISKNDLVNSGIVFSIRSLFLDRSKMSTGNDLVFAYKFGDYWKIYRPFNKDMKWMTNCPIDYMYGLENITEGCNVSLITKSVKDYLVCKKFITEHTAGVQNESTVAMNDENCNMILHNSKRPYVIFDNDAKGVESCIHYNKKGFGYWNIPKSYYNRHRIKDPSDFVKVYGPDRLRKEIEKKINAK